MNMMTEAGCGAVRGGRLFSSGTLTKHDWGKVRCRLRRPEERHELEGRAERECGVAHCDCKEHPEADAGP